MDIAFAVLSTLCLLCFLLYVHYFFVGHWSIYQLNYADKSFSFPRRIVSIFALAGLATCLVCGIDSMLFWFPESWRFKDEVGDSVSYKSAFTSTLCVFSLLPIIVILITFAKDQKDGLYYSVLAQGYKKILAAERNLRTLKALELDFIENAQKIEKKIAQNGNVHCKEYWEFQAYKDLLSEVENLLEPQGAIES